MEHKPKGLASHFATQPFCISHLTFHIFHFSSHSMHFMQLVVPRAVSAAVRMDTTTWMMFRHRSLFFIMISRPSLSFGHLPRGGGEPSGL